MLLKPLLESPKTSSSLFVYDPFREVDRVELVKEVIGLANAEVEGPRNILFGVNAGSVDGKGIVGIPETALADLKKAHRVLSALIEPVLQLAFIFDRINGKLVGALEIDGCDFGPYFVGHDLSESLSLGQCWIRDGFDLREVERGNLLGRVTSAVEPQKPVELTETPDISVGFNDDPACDLLELAVPDTSDPPFADEEGDTRKTSKFSQVIKDTVGTVTTQILRLGQGAPAKSAVAAGGDSPAVACDDADKVRADANNHYYYEEKALQVDLSVCSKGNEDLDDVSIEVGFPRLPGFDVADRLYTSPFDKRSEAEIRNLGYPEVERTDSAIFVRSSIGFLPPAKTEKAFRCALRLAVGPAMQGRKLAVHYKLRGRNRVGLGEGRLKIRFAKDPG